MPKLFVCDMDGTLLTDQKQLLPKSKDVLIERQKQGDLLVLASGRVKTRMLSYAQELKMDVYGGYLIEANGSVIYDIKKDKRSIIRSMSYEEAEEILVYLRKKYPTHEIMIMGDVNAFINLPKGEEESIFFNTNNMESLKNRKIIRINSAYEIKESFYKVCIYKDAESIKVIMEDIKSTFKDKYWCGRTMPIWCEIMPKGINKGNALKVLMDELHFSKENTYVFGDGENDLSMLALGHSIAMGNALDTVKAQCEFVTLSNEEDGIKEYIEKYVEE